MVHPLPLRSVRTRVTPPLRRSSLPGTTKGDCATHRPTGIVGAHHTNTMESNVSLEQSHRRFFIRQKMTLMANRYVVHAAGPDDAEGEVIAFAQQKRLAFKEQVTFYTDQSARQVLFTFKARQAVDLRATYDVCDATGILLGQFRKDFTASLLRSTWHMRQAGAATEATGKERNQVVALVRRVWRVIPFADLVPFAWPYHFDFAEAHRPIMSVVKRLGLRDRYILEVTAPDLDRRLAIAQAVALDALQSR
jgi:uncharacterized protein YxjI